MVFMDLRLNLFIWKDKVVMKTKIEEKYWTTKTIEESWRKQKIREECAETITLKFRRILTDRIKLSKEEVEWFKISEKGIAKQFIFNKKADVPNLMNKLFAIFKDDNKKELVSEENEEIVKIILSEIIPIPYEEVELSREEEIQECIELLDRMREFTIFKEKEFHIGIEMLADMQCYMYEVKGNTGEEKTESIQKRKYMINKKLDLRKNRIEKKVTEYFITTKQKYYFENMLREKVRKINDIQEYWEMTCQWCNKWQKIVERVKCVRDAEYFYNMYEFFKVNDELNIIRISKKEKSECYKAMSMANNEALKEYEQFFGKIGIGAICSYIETEMKQNSDVNVKKVKDEENCIKRCLDKMKEVQDKIINNLTMDDAIQVRELAFYELMSMGEIRNEEKVKLKDANYIEEEFQKIEKKQKTIGDITHDIYNMNKVDKTAMIGKYLNLKSTESDKIKLQKDLEYVYAKKQAQEGTILEYLPYRNFINI